MQILTYVEHNYVLEYYDIITPISLTTCYVDVYNALTIHGLAVADRLPRSVLDVSNFWKLTCYSIGGMVFSLDDIEHGILRGWGVCDLYL